MVTPNFYAMTDETIAAELGQRMEQLRLERNMTQAYIADELGLSVKTYRNAIKGKSSLETVIGILRVLNSLDNLEKFIPARPYSPIELLKLEGRKRKRASSAPRPDQTTAEEDSEW